MEKNCENKRQACGVYLETHSITETKERVEGQKDRGRQTLEYM